MASKPKDFLELKDALYGQAERLWTWSIVANGLALVAALVSVKAAADGAVGVGAGLCALAAPALALFLREYSAVPTDRADKIRSLVLYADSLGHAIPANEQARVRGWVALDSLAPAPYLPPYYASKLPPGAARLADNIAESAFFTQNLSERVLKALVLAAIASLGFFIVVVYLAAAAAGATPIAAEPAAAAASPFPLIARGAVVLVVFVIFGDCAVLGWRFLRLMNAAKQAFDSGSVLRGSPTVRLDEVIPLVDDYNAVRVQAPPIPRWLHKRKMGELNADYRGSHGGP